MNGLERYVMAEGALRFLAEFLGLLTLLGGALALMTLCHALAG